MHKNIDIQNELETISPFWQTLDANMPYQVPAQYFEELHGIVRAAIEKEAVYTELESVAPLLNSIPKTNVYQKPAAKQENTNFVSANCRFTKLRFFRYHGVLDADQTEQPIVESMYYTFQSLKR